MTSPLIIDTSLHWVAVFFYVLATVANTWGQFFKKDPWQRGAYRLVLAGLAVHGGALLFRWITSGHGPYIAKYEILSSQSWTALAMFLLFSRFFPRIRPSSIIVFPAGFLLIALALFCNPAVSQLPPTLRSVWLVLHVAFYKIALGTLIIALAFSLFHVVKSGNPQRRLPNLPSLQDMDIFALRFAGFGFTFWSIGMLSGSIWAYQSWGRFWGWDPVEIWSLATWGLFGIYLHLRRFFGWRGNRAAWFFIVCFLVSLFAIFATPLFISSIHAEYFK